MRRAICVPRSSQGGKKIVMKDIPIEAKKPADELGLDINEKRWLHTFNASLQFSQAYISPNRYQEATTMSMHWRR